MGSSIGKLPPSLRCSLLSFLLGVFVLTAVISILPGTAQAQPDDKKEEKKEEKKDEPAAKTKKEPDNVVVHFFKSIGWVFGVIFLAMSVGTVMIIVFLMMELRMGDAVSPAFVDEFTSLVNKRQFKQAYEICKEDNSFLGQVLTSGMGRLQYGIEDAREAMFNSVETVKSAKESMITYLATIGTVGPMLGLVGTVWGMIGAFRELGSAEGSPQASALAGHISHALVVTLVGIGMSVPAIFFFSFFKNRLTAISHNTSNLADDLLTQMYHNSKKAGSAPETIQKAR